MPKGIEPSEKQLEVKASDGEDGVDFVAGEVVKVVVAQTVLGFDVADHFAFDGPCDASGLSGLFLSALSASCSSRLGFLPRGEVNHNPQIRFARNLTSLCAFLANLSLRCRLKN